MAFVGHAVCAIAAALSLMTGCIASPASREQPAPYAIGATDSDSAPRSPPQASKCPLVDGPVTWSASLSSGKGSTGGCKISETGTLTIQRTGEKSASVVADGVWHDDSAAFDAKTCTVSHAGLKPKAPIDVTVSYVAVISPAGGLAGSAQAVVTSSFFGCKGQYAVSGSKQ